MSEIPNEKAYSYAQCLAQSVSAYAQEINDSDNTTKTEMEHWYRVHREIHALANSYTSLPVKVERFVYAPEGFIPKEDG